ncbi:UAA transporter, partial [Pholiota molesta]
LSMVFGGCCSNVLAYEQLLIMNPHIGSALTFSQMLFITLQSLPSFMTFSSGILPRLKPRQVPLYRWLLQVLVVTSGSLLNNWAFAYNVPLTILIVFRSAGLPVSMLFGFIFLKKRYTLPQMFSVVIVTLGVVLVTLSRPAASSTDEIPKVMSQADLRRYFTGIGMMTVSLFCTGTLGLLQERTYREYGPCWREGVFYTHFLSLPAFIFLRGDIKQGITSLVEPGSMTDTTKSFAILLGNLITQLLCVSGVNRLSSQVSSVSTNIALTARKALSLCFSVWWFGNEWNGQLGVGAFMVFFGSLLYTLNPDRLNKND